jgi:nicotinic acid mononucleotide adenylyltransferase
MTKRVLLYGISANPPTGFQGHLGALRHLKSLYDYDEIWLLPVYQHIYSTKRNLAPFEHRIQMCKLAVTALPNEGMLFFFVFLLRLFLKYK